MCASNRDSEKYKIKKIYNLEKIIMTLEKNDDDFNPPLSKRGLLENYAKKWVNEGVVLEISYKSNFAGIAVFYCNPESYKYSFLTFIAINRNYRGKGLSVLLMESVIDYCKGKGSLGLETQTSEENSKSLHLYTRLGFKEFGRIDNRENGIKSIQLRLIFNEFTAN